MYIRKEEVDLQLYLHIQQKNAFLWKMQNSPPGHSYNWSAADRKDLHFSDYLVYTRRYVRNSGKTSNNILNALDWNIKLNWKRDSKWKDLPLDQNKFSFWLSFSYFSIPPIPRFSMVFLGKNGVLFFTQKGNSPRASEINY